MQFKSAPAIPSVGRLKSITTGTSEVFKLDPRYLSREPDFNTRYEFGDISVLAADIEANGILEALKVRKADDKVFVINGDRRLTAIELLLKDNRWPEDPARPGYPMPVPCTSEGKGITTTDRIFMMLSLNTGKPFTLLEKGLAYVNILDAEEPPVSAGEISRRTGETKQAVSQAVNLVRKASPNLIGLIKAGTLSATLAYELTKTHGTDHSAQDAAAADAIAAASTNGRHHATAKDLPVKPPKDKPEPVDLWTYTSSPDHGWNENKVATSGNLATTSVPKLGIKHIILGAAISDRGKWYYGWSYAVGKGHTSCSCPTMLTGPVCTDENHAMCAAWEALAPILLDHTLRLPPISKTAALLYLTKLGNALHAQFTTGMDHDDSLFADPSATPTSEPPFIADLSDEDDEDDSATDNRPPTTDNPSKSPDAPADPSAFERLKNAAATNRDGSSSSGAGGSGGSGYASCDKRLKNVEELLDVIDPTKVNQDRYDTVEMFLDYLNGTHTIAQLKAHLTAL